MSSSASATCLWAAGTSGRTKALVDRVPNERVGEDVVTRGPRNLAHERRRGGGLEDLENFVLREASGPGQKVEVKPPTDHRCDGQGSFGAIPETGHSAPHDLSHAVGQGQRSRGTRPSSTDRPRLGRWLRFRPDSGALR